MNIFISVHLMFRFIDADNSKFSTVNVSNESIIYIVHNITGPSVSQKYRWKAKRNIFSC